MIRTIAFILSISVAHALPTPTPTAVEPSHHRALAEQYVPPSRHDESAVISATGRTKAEMNALLDAVPREFHDAVRASFAQLLTQPSYKPKPVTPEKAALVRRMLSEDRMSRALAEAATATGPSAADIDAAVKAATMTYGMLKEIVTGLLDEVESVSNEIQGHLHEIEGISTSTLLNYTSTVAQASTTVSTAQIAARNKLQPLSTMTNLYLKQLKDAGWKEECAYDTSKACEVGAKRFSASISLARRVFPVQATMSADACKASAGDMKSAARDFKQASAISTTMSNLIQDNLNNKDGWLNGKKQDLRRDFYGACGGSCVLGPICAFCFAGVVPYVENKINTLQDELNDKKAQLGKLAGRLDGMSAKSDDLNTRALGYYDSLTASAAQITTTNTMIKEFDDHALYEWKVLVVPMFEELQTQLQATIAVLAE